MVSLCLCTFMGHLLKKRECVTAGINILAREKIRENQSEEFLFGFLTAISNVFTSRIPLWMNNDTAWSIESNCFLSTSVPLQSWGVLGTIILVRIRAWLWHVHSRINELNYERKNSRFLNKCSKRDSCENTHIYYKSCSKYVYVIWLFKIITVFSFQNYMLMEHVDKGYTGKQQQQHFM